MFCSFKEFSTYAITIILTNGSFPIFSNLNKAEGYFSKPNSKCLSEQRNFSSSVSKCAARIGVKFSRNYLKTIISTSLVTQIVSFSSIYLAMVLPTWQQIRTQIFYWVIMTKTINNNWTSEHQLKTRKNNNNNVHVNNKVFPFPFFFILFCGT